MLESSACQSSSASPAAAHARKARERVVVRSAAISAIRPARSCPKTWPRSRAEMLRQQPPGQPIIARRRQPRAQTAQIADGRLQLRLRVAALPCLLKRGHSGLDRRASLLKQASTLSPAFERRALRAAATICTRRDRNASQSGRASHSSARARSTVASPTVRRRSLTANRAPAGKAASGLPSSTTFSGPFPIPSQTNATTSPSSVTRSHTRSKLASTLPVTPGRRMAAARKLMERAEDQQISKSANRRMTRKSRITRHSRLTFHVSRSPPTLSTSASRMPPATTDATCPAAFAPIACISRKLS